MVSKITEELLQREQAARAESEALLAATASLGVQAEPEAVIRTLVAQAAGLLRVDRASYAFVQEEQLVLLGIWLNGAWVEENLRIALDSSILGLVWRTKKPYRCNDLSADQHSGHAIDRQRNLRSQLSVPMLSPDGERYGVVSVFNSSRSEGFNERDERLFIAICEYASAILRRAYDTTARLAAKHEAAQRQREVEALLATADRLNAAVEPEEVMQRVVEIAAELLQVERVAVILHEEGEATIRHSWMDGVWKTLATPVPLHGSIAGWIIRHGQSYRSHDLSQNPLFHWAHLASAPPATLLGVPILGVKGQALGALNLFDRRDGQPFSDGDQRLAEGIAHQAAVAIERATLTAQLHRQAFSDSLTGLPNRALFMDRLTHALLSATRRHDGVAVLFLDLDGFKLINDGLGHAAGDEILIAVAERLAVCQRSGDTLARFGGDEFAVLIEDVASVADANSLAERLLTALRRPFSFKRREIFVTASIGIALSLPGAHRRRPEDLLREADTALYRANTESP